jgi:hypothetical protein
MTFVPIPKLPHVPPSSARRAAAVRLFENLQAIEKLHE